MTLRKYDTLFKTVRTMLNVGEFLAADELELMALDELRLERTYDVKMVLKRFYRGEINTHTLLAELELLRFGGDYKSVVEFYSAVVVFYSEYLNQGGRN